MKLFTGERPEQLNFFTALDFLTSSSISDELDFIIHVHRYLNKTRASEMDGNARLILTII